MIIDNQELHDTLNVISFSEAVEYRLREKKLDSYLKAAVDLASELDLEDKDVAKLLSPALKDKIQLEAIEDGLMHKESTPMMTF